MLMNPSEAQDEFTSVRTGTLNEAKPEALAEFSEIGGDR